MSISRLEKRARIETSLVKLPKAYKEFTITINSEKYINNADHSEVDFKYIIDREGPYIKNGHLNLSGGSLWECALSRLDMPNNFITFPSLSAVGNLNAAYFVLSFNIQYQVSNEVKHKLLRLPYFLQHEKFSTDMLIQRIISGITDLFAYVCAPNKIGINIVGEIFLIRCFHLYIDSRNKYVTIGTLGDTTENPFFKIFNNYFRKESFLEEENASNISLTCVEIFSSLHIINELGTFDFSSISDSSEHSNIFEHIKLDRKVFRYEIGSYGNIIQSSVPHKINKLSLLYFKSSIIDRDGNEGLGVLASIPIPESARVAIKYEPIRLSWNILKNMEIREIDFCLTDECNKILNYTGGNISFNLTFSTGTCSS